MKRKFLKITALFLSIITLFSILSSCASELDDAPVGSEQSNVEQNTDNTADASDKPTSKPTDKATDKATDKPNTDNPGKNDDNDIDPDGQITVYKNNSYKAKLVASANAKDFNKNFATQISNIIKNTTGKSPEQITDAQAYNGPTILIGETSYAESKEVYKTLKNNQAKAEIIGNKYVIAYSNELAATELFNKLKTLLKENASKDAIVIDKKWNFSLTAIDTSPEIINFPNKVMACDQRNGRIVIYDLDKYTQTKSLDSMEVRSFNVGHTGDVKYRTGTVFGDILLVTGDKSSANTGMYNFSTGKSIWTTGSPGSNPHAIEILPSGNIVIASSTDGKVRLFKTAALITNDKTTANQYTDYTLEDAHGVLWDPTYRVLWALGRYELKAYTISGRGTGEKLVEMTSMSIALPEGYRGGHDLSPDYTNTRYLYITVGEFALKIDKDEHKIITNFDHSNIMSAKNIKGFSNNPAGNFFITGELGGTGCVWDSDWYESWCTNTIYFCRYSNNTYEKIKLTSSKSAIYKARALCGTYQ